ncbi:MAG: methyltransferase domain-containing protein, partial [Clostridia bacterium]|nr:methyltransferase domain-containing protein [Clostridia bacterium]
MSYNSFAYYYDELTKNVDYKGRAEYISEILKEYNIDDGLLLDLACGTGSLSIEFSKLGFEVIGTDASFDMLSEAQNKASDSGENIMFLCQKMEETDLYGSVRAIVCALDSINHLTNYELVKKTFKNLKNFLDTDGIIVFDANTLNKITVNYDKMNCTFVKNVDESTTSSNTVKYYWTIDGIDKKLISSTDVDGYVKQFASLTALRSIDLNSEIDYGFDKPQFVANIKTNDSKHDYVLTVGNQITTLGEYYVCVNDRYYVMPENSV